MAGIFATLFLQRDNDVDLLSSYKILYGPSLPFIFNGNKFESISKFKKIILIIISILLVADAFRMIHQLQNQGENPQNEKFFGLYFCIGALSISTAFHYWNAIFNSHALLVAYNVWLDLKMDPVTPFTFALLGLFPVGYIITILVALLFLYLPHLPVFIFSATGLDKNGFRIFSFLILEIGRLYMMLGLHILSDSLLAGLYAAISCRIDVQLKNKNHSFGPQKMKEIQMLRIYDRIITNGMGGVLVKIKMLAYGQIICSCVMLIQSIGEWEFLNVIIGISFVHPLIFRMKQFLVTMAQVNSKCDQLLKLWKESNRVEIGMQKNRHDVKIAQRMLRAIKPIKPSIGYLYPVKGSTVLSFFSACMSNIVAILIAQQEKQNLKNMVEKSI